MGEIECPCWVFLLTMSPPSSPCTHTLTPDERGGDAGEDVVPGPAFVKGPGLIVRILLITGEKNYDYNYERPGEVVCPGPVLTVGGPSYTQWTPVITEKPGKDPE